MDRARLQELIQDQLDGELSAGGRAELARLLLQDGEARRLHDEFLRTDQLLREVPAADPPPGLREAILAGSMQPDRAGDAARGWQRLARYRIAAAVVGGLLIVGLGVLVSDGRGPGSELKGSLGAAVGAASLRVAGIAIDASLRRDGDTLRLEIASSAATPCEVAVQFDPATTSYVGGAGNDALPTAANEVAVRLPAGSRVTALDFSGAAPTRIELRADGRVLGEARLPAVSP